MVFTVEESAKGSKISLRSAIVLVEQTNTFGGLAND